MVNGPFHSDYNVLIAISCSINPVTICILHMYITTHTSHKRSSCVYDTYFVSSFAIYCSVNPFVHIHNNEQASVVEVFRNGWRAVRLLLVLLISHSSVSVVFRFPVWFVNTGVCVRLNLQKGRQGSDQCFVQCVKCMSVVFVYVYSYLQCVIDIFYLPCFNSLVECWMIRDIGHCASINALHAVNDWQHKTMRKNVSTEKFR